MKKKESYLLVICSIAAIVCVLFRSDVSFAITGEGIKLWDVVTLRPTFRSAEQFDSNVFLDHRNAKHDWISTVDAGTDVEMKLGDVLLNGSYLFNMNLFAEHENQNNYNHTVIGNIDWELTNYGIIVKDIYKHFSDRAGTENTSRISRQNNILSADFVANKFEKLAFDVGYDFVVEDYLSNEIEAAGTDYSEAEDRFEHTLRGEVSYKFLPKTSVLAEADFGLIDYFNSFHSDSYFIQPLLGLRGELLHDLTTEIKGGVRYQDYDRSTDRDFISGVVKGTLTKNFGEKDTLMFNVERVALPSTYRQLNYYTRNYAAFGYLHQFNDKWAANLSAAYQFSSYPKKTTEGGITAKRYDNLYLGSGSVTYNIQKWLSAELKYQYMQKDSRFENFNYIDNVISIGGLVKF